MVARNNSQVMPFLSASDAREGTRELITKATKLDLYRAGERINEAIRNAVAKQQTTVTVNLTAGFSEPIVKAMKRTFQKKGFLVKITSTQGLFEQGFVWQPRTYITLSWF